MNDASIKKSIIETVIWFECMKRPLTTRELFRNLWEISCSFELFESELFSMIDDGELIFYKKYIVRKKELVDDFLSKEQARHAFEKRISSIQRYLRYVPFLRGVYLVNSVSFGGYDEKSDIDLLIVCKKHYLWLARVWVTFLVSLLGIRRHHSAIEKRICLSFFVTENALNFQHLQKEDHIDIYLIYWIIWARPLIHSRKSNMLLQENQWIKKYVSYEDLYNVHTVRNFSFCARILESIFYYLGFGYLCNRMFRFFLKSRAERKHKKSTIEASVIISDDMLKFHEKDRRKEYFEMWRGKM